MRTDEKTFDRETVSELLTLLEKELARTGIVGEITILGGAMLVLAWNARKATRDIDALLGDPASIHKAARRVAARKHLPAGWLNDAIADFTSAEIARNHRSAFLDLPYLKVYLAEPEYLLATKLFAGRTGPESTDMQDVLFIMKNLRIRSESRLKTVFLRFYPPDYFTPKTRLFIKQAAALLKSNK